MQRPNDDDDASIQEQEDDTLLSTSTNSALEARCGPVYTSIDLHDYAQDNEHLSRHRLRHDTVQAVIENEKARRSHPVTSSSPSSIVHRLSSTADEESPHQIRPLKTLARPIGWKDLPNKGQLAILTMARLSEPLTQTSLQAYMFYQLKSFDQSLPDSTIASQAGILQGSFTAAQLLTAILWGRAADADWGGRKKVMLVGLFGTCVSCVGFGFSRSFAQAVFFRVLGGMLNGNAGVMRTMISEIIKEKK